MKEEAWKELNSEQKMKILHEGKVVVVAPKEIKNTTIPLFCPVCELPMKTREDAYSYRKEERCEKCLNRWGKKTPDMSSKEWSDYYEQRLKLSRPIINLK